MNKIICENKIKEIDDFLFESYKIVDIYKYLTPTNLIEENNKFLEHFKLGIEYNPIYEYKTNVNDFNVKAMLNQICQYKNELKELNAEKNEAYDILIKREIFMLEELEDIIIIFNNIGRSDNDIYFYSKKIYGEPNEELINNAKSILEKDYKKEEITNFDSNDCEKVFKKILKELELNWNIEINKVQSSKISVIPESRTIIINEETKFSKNDLKRLVIHEIGTHVLRAENAYNQPYKMFSIDIGKNLYTEEGLATVNEEEYNVLDERTFKIYAGRVLAISECKNKSFYEVFKLLLKYFTIEDALYIVSRVKRGIKNTKNHEVFVKDYVYLDGYYKVKKYLESQEKKKLYIGVIGIDEINDINKLIEYGILKEINYFSLNKLTQIFEGEVYEKSNS